MLRFIRYKYYLADFLFQKTTMKQRLLLFLSFLAFSLHNFAQEGIPVYFDYLADNYYLVYPSMAGIGEGAKIRATARKQWFDVQDAPNLQTANFHARIGDSNSGLGFMVFNDANGYHSQSGAKATYAHHLKLGGDARYLNQLSFGLSGTYLQSRLDESEFVSPGGVPDDAIGNGNIRAGYTNFDVGISYSKMEFYSHFAITNLLTGAKRNLYRVNRANPNNVPAIDNLRRYLVSAGYIFGRNEWQYEPSLLFQLTEWTKEKTIDINFKAYKDVDFGRIWGGLSYRRSFDGAQFIDGDTFGEQRLQLFTPIIGANISNFMVSYNYSYQSGSAIIDNGGFHQITLGYNFGQSQRKYDCYCPAAQ